MNIIFKLRIKYYRFIINKKNIKLIINVEIIIIIIIILTIQLLFFIILLKLLLSI
jgi:hypothetical protein